MNEEELPAAAMVVLIGAEPLTEWLRETVQRDAVRLDRARRLAGRMAARSASARAARQV